MRKIKTEEQLEIRNKAKQKYLEAKEIFDHNDIKEKLDMIKNQFELCEILYKEVFKIQQYKEKNKIVDRCKIDMRQVPSAMNYAGYVIDHDLLTKIFGGEDHVGKRSVKKVRDGLTHDLKKSYVKEAIDRYDELIGYMDEFIKLTVYFDE